MFTKIVVKNIYITYFLSETLNACSQNPIVKYSVKHDLYPFFERKKRQTKINTASC